MNIGRDDQAGLRLNAAQHLADLEMLSEKEELKPAFVDCKTNQLNKVQFIRVDGRHDEGPSHCEVQYWWTVWNLKRAHAL